MNIQTRITVLLVLIAALFFTGLLMIRRYENSREALLIKNNIYEKNTLFDKILRLEGTSLEMFAYDFSNINETVRIAQQAAAPGPDGGLLRRVLPSFNVHHIWIYTTDFAPVYTTAQKCLTDYHAVSSRQAFFNGLFSRSYFCHFFIRTPEGLMEIRSAPVQPASDWERTTRPVGFLFAGRLWSPGYIKALSQSAESQISVLPLHGYDEISETSYNQEKGFITFSRILYGWDETPLSQIVIRSDTPVTKQLHRSSRNQLLFIVIFVASLMIMLSILLIVWVNLPLKKISRSLNTENATLIAGMQHTGTEFGRLAQLILRFFRQKEELTREVAERQRAENALREALEKSRRSGAETAALLQASRAVLEYHEFRESARAIIDACMSLSGATKGFIAEIDAGNDPPHLLLDGSRRMSIKGIFREAFDACNPRFCNNCSTPDIQNQLPAGHLPLENILCAPLQIKGETAAMLTVANKPGGFSENDLRMATAFSEISSVALLNSRTLTSLEISEERFRSVVQTAGDAIITVSGTGKIAFWNREAEKMFGYSLREAAGSPAAMLLPERYQSLYKKTASQITEQDMQALGDRPLEMLGRRKDGSEFPIELSQAMWKTTEGIFFTAIVRDISQRKQSEEDLRRSEKRFRAIVENSLTGRFIVQDGSIVYMNKEQERLFGELPDDFNILDCTNVHADDIEDVRRFYNAVLSGETDARDVHYRFYPVDRMNSPADMRWVTCRATLIEYEGRESLFVNMMDITRFMELERLVRMQDKMASLGRVAAGIAHEIRNPLTGINSFLYSLKQSIADGPQSRRESLLAILDQIQSASDKIEAVIRRVMDFTKPAAPRLLLVNINEPIEEALELSAVTLRKSSVTVKKTLDRGLPPCYADFHMLEQVILNLVSNAAQALSSSGIQERIIEIATVADGGSVIVTVADSGPGIPEAERDRIFDPFYTTKSDGSGIGLSMCHRIITDHGGTIKVAASKWGGAEFRLHIPADMRKKQGRAQQSTFLH